MGKTAIEWAEETWNPIVGCTKVSSGCKNCYAERLHNKRHRAVLNGWLDAPEQYEFPFNQLQVLEDRLEEPKRWRKPRSIFCCSMGDLFHEQLRDHHIMDVLNVMVQVNANRISAGQVPHRFMVLTKRARRMRRVLEKWLREFRNGVTLADLKALSSIWFGVSVESQEFVHRAIKLASIRSPVPLTRFVSAEPLLGPLSMEEVEYEGSGWFVNLYTGKRLETGVESGGPTLHGRINWVIVGGETGPGARPMHPEWVRTLRNEAYANGTAFFFKQWGEWFPREQWEFNPELILPGDDVYEHDPNTVILEDHTVMHRVGRRKAGRMLDGEVWEQYPRIPNGTDVPPTSE